MKIGFTADSSSGLEYAPFKHQVKITKTTIHFGDETLIDGVDITADEFYLRLEKEQIVPTTSAPTLGEILEKVLEYKRLGYKDVIHFPISTNLSAYGKHIQRLVQNEIPDINFKVIDTKAATLVQGYLVSVAEKLASMGKTPDEIENEILELRSQMQAYFIVDNLKYLIKNGRLSNITGTIGILAKIKPILSLTKDGKIETIEKVRTHHKATESMFQRIKEEAKKYKKVTYMVLHTNRLDDALIFKERILKEMDNVHECLVSTITPTVGAHIGSKILGAGYVILDAYDYL